MPFSPADIPNQPTGFPPAVSTEPSPPNPLLAKTPVRRTSSSTGLVNRKTDLRSLKFGTDRRGGGTSGHPYFIKDIPDYLANPYAPFGLANSGGNFLVRSGFTDRVLEDQIRLGNYFRGPQGALFISKQNLLAQQNPVIGAKPTRVYTPLSTLAQSAGNPTGLHVVKDGTNLAINDEDKYFRVTQKYNKEAQLGNTNKNKLLLLYETKIITPTSTETSEGVDIATDNFITAIENGDILGSQPFTQANRNMDQATSINSQNTLSYNRSIYGISPDKGKILEYIGGPNATFGGKSQVRRVFDTNEGFERNKMSNEGESKYLTFSSNMLKNRAKNRVGKTGSTSFESSKMTSFTSVLRSETDETGVDSKRKSSLIGTPPNYSKFNRETTYGEGNPGKKNKKRSSYYTKNLKNLSKGEAQNIYEYDKVNAQKLYSSTGIGTNVQKDTIKFYIGVMNPNNVKGPLTWVHFRAYMNSFSDTYNAEWQPYKYMGRGNPYYRYSGYERSISMGFEVVVHSRYEQSFVYSKLNYLASTTAPNYSDIGYMRGNIIKLTIGDYINDTFGILTNLSYSIPEDASWDIAKKEGVEGAVQDENSLELPMRISVSNFDFKPIHNFYDSTVDTLDRVPDQRFISLGNEGGGYETALAK